jgi:hypothetical protein
VYEWFRSEQQLVDCTYGDGYSCQNGGWEEAAWQYLATSGGQAVETSYPYTAIAEHCKLNPLTMEIGAKLSSNAVEWIPSKDVNAMMRVLTEGRIISIYIQLPLSFNNYR